MKKTIPTMFLILAINLVNSQCWRAVSTGGNHTIAVTSNGSLVAWGRNQTGQLGNGNATSLNVPTKIGVSVNWQKVSAGNSHSLSIKTNGTLWAWGRNSLGQLGNGTGGSGLFSNIPIQVGTDTNWSSIAAGDEYSTAIKVDGTLWAWGENQYGQCGDGTTITKNVPTQIGTDADWAIVSAGTNHTLAIKTNGTLWAWGYNNSGQLGDGTIISKTTPIQIGTDNDWDSVVARLFHSVALKTNGLLLTWGSNANGQLGDGTLVDKNTPQNISAPNIFLKIAAGSQHTIAKTGDGSLSSWGGNLSGQMGDGTTISKTNPTAITSTITTWTIITSKISHSAGLKSDGNLYLWGSNIYGQVGDGTNTNKTIPTLILCPTLSNEDFADFDNNFKIYPNPTNSFLNIENIDNEIVKKISINNILGETILEKSQNTALINVENLQNGIYFITIYTEDKNFQTKFIKN